MRGLIHLTVRIVIVTILLPIALAGAQTPAKKSQSLPQVPITYPGDTNETILRRAQWIEGAKKEQTVDWWGSLNPNEAKKIIPEFNKVYPFVKVVYWRGRSDEIAAKLEAEYAGGRHVVDFMLGGNADNYPRWAKMGILDKFTSIIPGIEKFDKRMVGNRGDWVLPAFNCKTPQYNTKLVSTAEAPKSWEDLLNPKWKGHMGIEVDLEDWVTLTLGVGGWGAEKAEDFLAKLKEQKPRVVQGSSATHSLLIAGEFKITAMGNLRHILISQKKKANVDWVRTNPIVAVGPPLILSKKSPHPNAARLFLEWVLSPQGLLVWAEASQSFVPGVATPIAKIVEGRNLVILTEEVLVKEKELGLVKKFNKLLLGIEE